MTSNSTKRPRNEIQGVRRGRSNLSSAAEILNRSLRRETYPKKVLQQQRVRYEGFLHWKEVIGDKFFPLTKPLKISRGGALVIQVIDSVIAQELTFQKQNIIDRFNSVSDRSFVQDLSFVIGSPKDFDTREGP